MLHHIPFAELQDRAFGEVARVLRPGGTFAGTDSVGTGKLFKLIHLGDMLLPIDPDEMPARLEAAGLEDVEIKRVENSFRFRARRRGMTAFNAPPPPARRRAPRRFRRTSSTRRATCSRRTGWRRPRSSGSRPPPASRG